jgi:hypothetical protein
MARKNITVSDISGVEIEHGKGAVIRATFDDARKSSREMDVTVEEAESIMEHARITQRRGRKPRAADNGD